MLTLGHESERPALVKGLPSLDVEGLASYINNGYAKKILILTGAGISVSAGIPDFRSPGTGVYSNLHKYNLPYPECIFTRKYFNKHPEPFFEVTKDLLPGDYKPTLVHYLSVILNSKGILHKYYTQNVDDLDRRAGLPLDKLVECHGTFRTATCNRCGAQYPSEYIRPIMPEVPHCNCGGIIVPDVLLFGDDYVEGLYDQMEADFESCDLLIVMGTSLSVEPFPTLIEYVPTDIPRVLINNKPVITYKERLTVKNGKIVDNSRRKNTEMFKFGHFFNRRDIFIDGDVQESVLKLIDALGWREEFDKLVENGPIA